MAVCMVLILNGISPGPTHLEMQLTHSHAQEWKAEVVEIAPKYSQGRKASSH